MDQTKSLGRRDVLRAGAGLALASTAASAPAAAQQQPFDGFLANTSNFDGVVDERGSDSVTVAVGAEGNNGNYAFGPAAIQVDPGTTVVVTPDSLASASFDKTLQVLAPADQ